MKLKLIFAAELIISLGFSRTLFRTHTNSVGRRVKTIISDVVRQPLDQKAMPYCLSLHMRGLPGVTRKGITLLPINLPHRIFLPENISYLLKSN